MMSFGSNEPAQDYEGGLTSSVDLNVPPAISDVTLFLALVGVLIAIYLAATNRAAGAAALNMVLAGISLSVSLTIGCLVTAEASNPSAWIYLVNVLPAVVLLVSAATLHRHTSTPEVAR